MSTADEREVKRKLKVLHHAEQSGKSVLFYMTTDSSAFVEQNNGIINFRIAFYFICGKDDVSIVSDSSNLFENRPVSNGGVFPILGEFL